MGIDLFQGIILYILVGNMYGLHCAISRHPKRCCSAFSKQGLKIMLFSPYYILEDIFKGVK